MEDDSGERLALVMGGGGARAAYQVGLLSFLARKLPDLQIPILAGVSAGAINTVQLASSTRNFGATVQELRTLWENLTVEQVFEASFWALTKDILRWGMRLLSGGSRFAPRPRGLVDTAPLRAFLGKALGIEGGLLPGIESNIAGGKLDAVALTTTNYGTGQSITWVQGKYKELWVRPNRRAIVARLTLDHVMASAALPFFFPAVRLDDTWHGDGGVRLTTPLSPALHLGGTRILAISTRYQRSQVEADVANINDYPPPAQIAGVLMNAIFLDMLDYDATTMAQVNSLLRPLTAAERGRMRVVDMLVVRPSRDLGKLAGEFEVKLPGPFRFLTRGLGSRETRSPDMLSMLMFVPAYLRRLIEIGEADAERRADEILAFVSGAPHVMSPADVSQPQ